MSGLYAHCPFAQRYPQLYRDFRSGLALPLASFEVTLAVGLPPAIVSAPEGGGEVARWKIRDLSAPPGFAAALVVEGHDWEIQAHEL